jgi:hypothetical protein
MIHTITIDPIIYQNTSPFPYGIEDGVIEEKFAKDLQAEILAIPREAWDRYSNPFEDKFTLRDKYNFPPLLTAFFKELESDTMVETLSHICGHQLYLDPTRNFWGVHTYNSGDKLDIHVDAGLHPVTKQKKKLTLGFYLSYNWTKDCGCELEIWKGENAASNDAKLIEKITSIAPMFNRMILFTCNDYAWHGNPLPVHSSGDAKRIFVTISYLSNDLEDQNKRLKAYFIARPNDPEDPEKDRMRLLRADPDKYKEVYRMHQM